MDAGDSRKQEAKVENTEEMLLYSHFKFLSPYSP